MIGTKEENYAVHRKGKELASAGLLIILGIQLLLSVRIATSQLTETQHPSGYNLVGATTYTSGGLTNLQTDDSIYMTFRSYFSGTDTSDFVDNDASDVDSSADKGEHSNFSAQQSGPDSIYDVLTEGNTASISNTTLIDAESFEGTWPPTGWTETGAWNRESNSVYDGIYSADFDGFDPGLSGNLDTPELNCADATAIYVSFYFSEVCSMDSEFRLQFWNGSAWDNIEDLGLGYSAGWNLWEMKVTDSQYYISNFQVRWLANDVESFEYIYVDLVSVRKEVGTYNYELDLEAQWSNVDYDETNEELAVYIDEGNNTHSIDAAGGYMIIGDGTVDWGSITGTISFWIKWNSVGNRLWGQHDNMEVRFSGSNMVVDWGAAGSITSSTSFIAGRWYFIAIVWNENTDDLHLYVGNQEKVPEEDTYVTAWTGTVSDEGVTENNFMASRGGLDPTDGHGDDLRYWDIDRTLVEIQSDYKTELTGSEANLKSYFKLGNNFADLGPEYNDGSGVGSYSFSSDVPFGTSSTENIRVDVWDGAAWQNLVTELTNGWNNISVSSCLTTSTFTIRFKGDTETVDATQDSWNVDVVLLRVWSDKYTVEVEFVGLSDTDSWSRLDWSVDCAWTTGAVGVTLQLYDYSLGDYSTNGNGYLSYVSSTTANTDELGKQTVTVNPTHFRNSTGYWKIKVKGVKMTDVPFDFKADLVKYEATSVARAQPFDWRILCALLAVFGLVFLSAVKLNRKKKPDTFSGLFRMTHKQMIGKKMLLEIDPTSDYHKALLSFASEAGNSSEPLLIFTSANSAVHSALPGAENVKFFLLTSNASSVQQINENVTLLPAHDLSIMLNASVEALKSQKGKIINMLFDNISSIIIRCGFEKSYSFMNFLLEAVSSPKATALFVFNPAAHDPEISSSIRGLFHNQLAFTKSGPKIGTLQGNQMSHGQTKSSPKSLFHKIKTMLSLSRTRT